MLLVNNLESVADHSCPKQPKVGKLGQEWTWVLDKGRVGDEWHEVEEDDSSNDGSGDVSGRFDGPLHRSAYAGDEVGFDHFWKLGFSS